MRTSTQYNVGLTCVNGVTRRYPKYLHEEVGRQAVYYFGLDVHTKQISYCVQYPDGALHAQGEVATTRTALSHWGASPPSPWLCTMAATLFTGWVYDFLTPHARALKVAHPAMLKAITAAKKKNDRDDARRIADLLPECYMASSEIRELRRVLRFRNKIVHQAVAMKNKMAGLLMEVGAEYAKKRLHGQRYFAELLAELEKLDEISDTVSVGLREASPGVRYLFFQGVRCYLSGPKRAGAVGSLLENREPQGWRSVLFFVYILVYQTDGTTWKWSISWPASVS